MAETGDGRERWRPSWPLRVVAGGAALGVLGAAGVAAIGGSGTAGLAVVLLGLAVGCVAGGLVAGISAVVDEARRRPVGLGRVVTAFGLFLAGVLALALAGGLA